MTLQVGIVADDGIVIVSDTLANRSPRFNVEIRAIQQFVGTSEVEDFRRRKSCRHLCERHDSGKPTCGGSNCWSLSRLLARTEPEDAGDCHV